MIIVQVAIAASHETVLAYEAPDDIKVGDRVSLPYFVWQNERVERRPHGIVLAIGRGEYQGPCREIVGINRDDITPAPTGKRPDYRPDLTTPYRGNDPERAEYDDDRDGKDMDPHYDDGGA